MALTITTPSGAATGAAIHGGTPSKFTIKRVQFDSSYPTGGESLSAADLGFTALHMVIVQAESTLGYVAQYDYTNEKIEVYEAGADGAALDEVANTTNLSSLYVRVLAYGIA
tara:strand:+ start:90 stop:425 length:336 start_codon:yes stop_codon:yes gene_type:complete